MASSQESVVVDAADFVAGKLRWQLRLLCDTNLSTAARLLGALLTHDFDTRRGGYAWRGQGQRLGSRSDEDAAPAVDRIDTYATRSGFDVRTIQRAAAELEFAGYLRIERGQGRGHSNKYWPILDRSAHAIAPQEKATHTPPFNQEKATHTPPFNQEKATHTPPFNQEKATHTPPFNQEKAASDALKGGLGVAQYLKEPINTPLPPIESVAGREGLGEGGHGPLGGASFLTREAAIAAVIEAAGLGEGDAAILRAFRFDPKAQRLIAVSQTALISINARAGEALVKLGLRTACGAIL
jgi:hypothetical protein